MVSRRQFVTSTLAAGVALASQKVAGAAIEAHDCRCSGASVEGRV